MPIIYLKTRSLKGISYDRYIKIKMLKNIIFDMGNVLIGFIPDEILDLKGITDPKDRRLLKENIYLHEGWKQMDLGVLAEDDFAKQVKDRLPEQLHATADDLIYHWYEPLCPIKGIEKLIRDLKHQGYRIFILSNAALSYTRYIERIPAYDCFDGIVISAEEKCVKPHSEFFRILCERYDIDPKESLFIDDMKANIEGAKALGFDTFLFDHNVSGLKRYIEKKGGE